MRDPFVNTISPSPLATLTAETNGAIAFRRAKPCIDRRVSFVVRSW